MRLYHRFLVLGLALAGMALAVFGSLTPAQAAPSTVFGPPTEGQKVTLADTSIDGPALWTSPTGAMRAILAWTGTDGSHHLNYMTSGNGLSFSNKHTLSETSPFRPAIAAVTTDANPTVELAWTGTDPAHHVNLLSGVPGQGFVKVTLHETSFTAPALALNGGTVYLAWAGTDPNHSINVVPVLWRGGISVGTKVTLPQFSSISRPNLAFDPTINQLILSYTAASGRIHFATSPDGVHWSVLASSPLLEWSDVSPTMAGFATNNMPRYFVAWRGIDGAHSLNVQYTESFPRWALADSKATLSEVCFGGPTLGFVGTYRQVLVAWTGLDTAHHLNVAVVSM
jgi:hypothetical protein